MIVVTSAVLQLVKNPFTHDTLDDLEAAALCTQFLTLSFGLYLFSDNTTDTWRVVITGCIFAVNIVFLAYAARKLGQNSDVGSLRKRMIARFSSSKKDAEAIEKSAADGRCSLSTDIEMTQPSAYSSNPMRAGKDGTATGALPKNWVKLASKKGETYFYNNATSETSWTRPSSEDKTTS